VDVDEAIRTKHATRKFADQPVPAEAVRRIVNAGRRAQSSKNTQPWHFVVVRGRETLQQLSTCGTYAGHLAGAALAVAFVSSEPSANWWVGFDLGQAAGYMQLAAWEMGLGSCIATFHQPERARPVLGLPAGLVSHFALSFGYPAPGERRPDVVRQGGRRPFDEVVHWERWGGKA
jgi:nitroreductase